jgi:hypothetical protein
VHHSDAAYLMEVKLAVDVERGRIQPKEPLMKARG